MTLYIFDFFARILQFLFSCLGRLINLAGSAASFLLEAAAAVFSALGKIFCVPFQLGAGAADLFNVPLLWTPLFVLVFALLLFLLLVLTGWALAARRRR